MPSFHKNTSGGASVSGGALAPRSRRGNTNQADDYWRGGVLDFGAFESIATTTLSSSTASITFSSIPSTYKHLQIRYFVRTDRADVKDEIAIVYNGDTTGSNYSFHHISGDGATVFAYGGGSEEGLMVYASGANTSASIFGVGVADILDYASTDKYKTHRSIGGYDNNSAVSVGHVGLSSGVWRNTAAITSIRVAPNNATNFVQYSSFALYGIKA